MTENKQYVSNINGYYVKDAEARESLNGKADTGTTLSDYGITDAYTKNDIDYKMSEVDEKIEQSANNLIKLTETCTIEADSTPYAVFSNKAESYITLPDGYTRENTYVTSARAITPSGEYLPLITVFYDSDRKVSNIFNYGYPSDTTLYVYYGGSLYNIDDEITFELLIEKFEDTPTPEE